MEKLIIKRSQWLRGEGSDLSMLLRKRDHKMCCLGFAALASGYTEDDIMSVGSPSSMELGEGEWKGMLRRIEERQDRTTVNFITVNDDIRMSDYDREQQLTQLFSKIDVEVTFED